MCNHFSAVQCCLSVHGFCSLLPNLLKSYSNGKNVNTGAIAPILKMRPQHLHFSFYCSFSLIKYTHWIDCRLKYRCYWINSCLTVRNNLKSEVCVSSAPEERVRSGSWSEIHDRAGGCSVGTAKIKIKNKYI